MNYKENTVFNFKIFYYLIRIFSIFWLIQNYIKYERVAKRSEEFYRTTYWLQEVFFPVFPSFYYYVGLLLVSLLFITLSLFRPKIIYNIILFFITTPFLNLIFLGINREYHLELTRSQENFKNSLVTFIKNTDLNFAPSRYKYLFVI